MKHQTQTQKQHQRRPLTRTALGSSFGRFLCLPCLLVATMQGPSVAHAAETVAIRADEFLNSIGVCSAVSRRGENLSNTVNAARYLGLRWFRAGYESRIPVADLIELHRQTGVRFSYGLMSGGTDIARLLEGARQLAAADALIALEGNNEPNNWGVTYEGQRGGRTNSWLPVAKLQRDLYRAVKNDPMLKDYPVWSLSENGAETDNVGLQFLTIPSGGGTLMPDETQYADYANCHNYMTHPGWPGLHDNQTWIAADPTSACRVDGLYGNYGRTWRRRYPGYSEAALLTLPRVTTETGVTIQGAFTEQIQALLYLSVYLDQFKRGWKHTAIYLLRDRTDEGGNQTFGFYKPDYSPRLAAAYLHNLTMILADKASETLPGKLDYSIPSQPATVHDLLLQKSDGRFELVVWDERFTGGSDEVTVKLGAPAASVKLFDPTTGTSPVQTLTNVSSIPLILSNHPVIIEILGPTRSSGVESAKPSASPSVETGVLTGLGKTLKIRAGASSFEGLVHLTSPTFTWKGCELIWIHTHPSGMPTFELDHAFVYQPPGAEPQWVLVQSLDGEREEFAEVVRAFHTHAVATVPPAKPVHDGGAGNYALALASNLEHGVVYEVGWEGGPQGMGCHITGRRFYFLHDSQRQWHFLGEGPSEASGHAGREAYRSTSTAEAVWDAEADLGVNILVTAYTAEYTLPNVEDSVAERERTWRAVGVLDSASKEIRWLPGRQDSQAGQTVAPSNSLPVVPHVEAVMGATFTNPIVTGALLSNSLPVAPRLVAFVNQKQMLRIEAFQADYKPTKVLTTKMVDAFQYTPQGPRRLRLLNPANHCLIAKDSLVGSPPWTLTITLKPNESPWGWPKEMPKADLQPKTWSFIYEKEWVNQRW